MKMMMMKRSKAMPKFRHDRIDLGNTLYESRAISAFMSGERHILMLIHVYHIQ